MRPFHSRGFPSFLGIVNEKLHLDEKWHSTNHSFGRVYRRDSHDQIT
ncbi:hypothetical protein ALT1545_110012 [Alteromonas macleodii]